MRRLAAALAVVPLLATACQRESQREIALRILDRHRSETGAKPLPAAHVIRMRLFPDGGSEGTGTAEIAWGPNRYRQRVTSAGVTTEWGLQGGKAYYTDEDGVTRVVSEPVVRELITRSYFWRRGWLFADVERARLALGPADAVSLSVRLTPAGGNALVLSFSREGRLLSARSPGFQLDFSSAAAFRESGGRQPPVRGEIAWTGLPTGPTADAEVGGGCARFSASGASLPFETTSSGGVAFPARVNGAELRLTLDSTADGPLRLSAESARRLGLSFSRDVYGRSIAGGAVLEAGGLSCPGIHVQEIPRAPEDTDGVVGSTIFREAVVELDPAAGRIAFHDPARWVPPEAFTRALVDDDGNRPIGIVSRRAKEARVLIATVTEPADLLLAEEAAARLSIELPGRVGGLRWGPVELPEASAAKETRRALPEWGDDGTLGLQVLLRFHVHLDMTHRWVYLKPR